MPRHRSDNDRTARRSDCESIRGRRWRRRTTMNSPRTTAKRRPSTSLQWLLLLIGSAAVLYYFALRPTADEPTTTTTTPSATAAFLVSNMSAACIVAYSPESDFPIQNLPYGVFLRRGSSKPHIGVAIGALSKTKKKKKKTLHCGSPIIFFVYLYIFFKKKGDSILDLTVASERGLLSSNALLTHDIFASVRSNISLFYISQILTF
jgi:hypothetical protein